MAKDGSNWYNYCNNDPVNNIDPSGLSDTHRDMQGYEEDLRIAEALFALKIAPKVTVPKSSTTTTKSQVQITGGYTSQHAPSFPSPYSWEQNFAKAEEKFWAKQTPTYIVPDITPTNPNTQNSQEFFNDVVFDAGMNYSSIFLVDVAENTYKGIRGSFQNIDDLVLDIFKATKKASVLDNITDSLDKWGFKLGVLSTAFNIFTDIFINDEPPIVAFANNAINLGVDLAVNALTFAAAGAIGSALSITIPAIIPFIAAIGISTIVTNAIDNWFDKTFA